MDKDGKKVEYNSVGRMRIKKHFCEFCGKVSEGNMLVDLRFYYYMRFVLPTLA